MKNTFGNAVTLTLFGESHGQMIGCVLDGLAPGIAVSMESIAASLALRRPQDSLSTARREPDPVSIVSGVLNGKTTGTPLCLLIPNSDQRSKDYEKKTAFRPGHADFSAQMKYHGYQDVRGGGHFSGRITAALVAAGAILSDALKEKGVFIGTHIKELHGVSDVSLTPTLDELKMLSERSFAVLDPLAEKKMQEEILAAKASGDSVGGVLESAVLGLPAGVGEPWFDSLEGMLSHALFSIPGIKAVEFGDGFALSGLFGSQANDAFCLDDHGKIKTRTNHNGGINGGISNGMPVVFRCAVKPTPTISKKQDTVDSVSGQAVELSSAGRHDPCIVHRARIVVDSITALVLFDALTSRFGTDFFCSESKR